MKTFGYIVLAVIMMTGYAMAGTQSVSLEPASAAATAEKPVTISLKYTVSEGAQRTTGLGLRIHYNSKAVDSLKLGDVFGVGFVAQDEVAKNDTEDFDKDPATDKYIGVAWVGVQGDWPNLVTLPAELGKLTVKVKTDSGIPVTGINVTASDTAAGYTFDGQSAAVTLP